MGNVRRGAAIKEELSWHLCKEGSGQERLDIPPYREYFYWEREGRIIHSAEYTKAELQAQIRHRKREGGEVTEFEIALKQLG
jgi:hypothetical protein